MQAPGRARGWPVALALVLAVAGSALIDRIDVAARRAAFETDARIAHRLLSQRAAQNDAILATLSLLPDPSLPGLSLPAELGQVLQVRRGGTAPEPPPLASGRYTLQRSGPAGTVALDIDARALVPADDWPYAPGGPVQVELQQGEQRLVLTPAGPAAGSGGRFEFRKRLAAESQPFDVVVVQVWPWWQRSWAALALWWSALALAAVGLQAWRRQRDERRRAQELLRLGQVGRLNALGELAAGMAHELNQPLTAVSANAQAAQRLLDDDPPDTAGARDAMAQAVAQARRAAGVVARLRRLVERPDVGSRLQPCALGPVLREALDLLRPECRRLGVQPLVQGDETLRVRADPVALEQIVHNLLSNALHALAAVPEGERRLQLSLSRQGSQGQLQVQDSGPGIAPEALPRLFEPFFTTRDGGLGLGLSLCESLATGMGGSIAAAHAAPRGACFTLKLDSA